jgi:transcriptional regulator with XRE-family HTH domain
MKYIPVINKEKTGENIRKLRNKSKLTRQSLADMTGFLHPQSIVKWEHGITMPSIDNLVALSMIFGVLVEDIVHVDMVKIQ